MLQIMKKYKVVPIAQLYVKTVQENQYFVLWQSAFYSKTGSEWEYPEDLEVGKLCELLLNNI